MSFYLRWMRTGPKSFYATEYAPGITLSPSKAQSFKTAAQAFEVRKLIPIWDVVEVLYALRWYDNEGKPVEGAAYRGPRGGMYPRADAAVFDTVEECRKSCSDILYPNEHCTAGYRVVRLTKKVKS